jgi:hypothetical protein
MNSRLNEKQNGDSASQTNIFFCEKLKSFCMKEFEKVILKLFTTSTLQPSRFCSNVAPSSSGVMPSKLFLFVPPENGTPLATSGPGTKI